MSASPIAAIFRMRAAALRGRLLEFHRDTFAKGLVVILGLALITGFAHQVAYLSFRFIDSFPAVGPVLNERLLSVLFLVLLVMVAFSTAVIAYTALFLGEETEFLLSLPTSPKLVFALKFSESVALSAWATLVLGFPALAAFGRARSSPLGFYLQAAAALIVFLVFCGFAGGGLMLVLIELVRRWNRKRLIIVAALLIGIPGWLFLRSFEFGAIKEEESLQALDRFTAGLAAIRSPFFPGHWASTAVVAAAGGHGSEFLFQGGILLANTLIFIPVFGLYGRSRYVRRWLIARDPVPIGEARAKGEAGSAARRIPRTPFPRTPARALLWKDALVFARDPSQLSQFFLFLLLLTVYVVSLLRIPHDLFGLGWRLLLYFGNLGAVSLILSSLTSRFLFPLPSLEGRSFWVVGLAPVERDFLLRQKAFAGAIIIVSLGAVAAIASGLFLGFGGWLLAGAVFDVVVIGWCLAAMAAGFGAAYPNLTEDNPARIAVGLGGTLNFFASAATIVAALAIEGAPYLIFHLRPPMEAIAAAHLGTLVFSAAAGFFALRLGRRAMRDMEF